jgi:hypothetical protein
MRAYGCSPALHCQSVVARLLSRSLKYDQSFEVEPGKPGEVWENFVCVNGDLLWSQALAYGVVLKPDLGYGHSSHLQTQPNKDLFG